MDILSGFHPSRMVCVVGDRGVGKTLFLDRAMAELDPDRAMILVSAKDLVTANGRPAESAGLPRLCRLVAEAAEGLGVPATDCADRAPGVWWNRLLADVGGARLTIGIDDLDVLDSDVAQSRELLSALALVPRRRSRIRLGVAGRAIPAALTESLDSARVQTLDLKPLQWADVWLWIRRNVPSLARYQERELSGLWSRLPRLEDWERLAGELRGGSSALAGSTLPQLAALIGATPATSVYAATEPAASLESLVSDQPKQRAVLRVAVAGPFTEGRAAGFAQALTTFAADHRVGGRVAVGSTDPMSALAELVAVASPFRGGVADEAALVTWLDDAAAAGADVVVLDFGGLQPLPTLQQRLHRLADDNRLVLAASGMGPDMGWPARDATVLAVGAVDDDGDPMPWSPFDQSIGKPELYAPASLAGTPMAAAVALPDAQGTSAAAIYAGAAATLVWASDLSQTADRVRSALLATARSGPGRHGVPVLDLSAALTAVRTDVVLDRLSQHPMPLSQVAAETGMPPDLVAPLLRDLTGRFVVTAVAENGIERFGFTKAN